MKIVKLSIILVAAFAIMLGFSATSFAFHSGGVAECEGCHSMHNSFEGSANVTGRTFAAGTGPYLLKANDQAGACLNCHNPATADTAPSSYHISTAGITPSDSTTPVAMTPGGDFAWLKKTMSFVVRGSTTTNDGNRHGHNIVAIDFGYAADDSLTTAPGGNYPAGNLACSSCHDPHGKYRRFADDSYATTGLPIFASGSYNNSVSPIASVSAVGAYRILGGNGYLPKSMSASGAAAFTADPMDVVVASTYNRAETTDQTGIAYGKNVSEWCANCHTGMLSNGYTAGMAGLRHPAGNNANLTADIIANYNSYVTSGIMTNTATNKAFSTLAPFQTGVSKDRNTAVSGLKAQAKTGTAGASNHLAAATGDNVMCLSCHRAHATAFESMIRWNYAGNEMMTVADASNAAAYDTANGKGTGYSVAQQQAAYYGRQASAFGPNARSFCNKCHAKD
jgi:hypothetical protein